MTGLRIRLTCLGQEMLYTTCAPCGIGKLPIGAFTRTLAAAVCEGEGDAVCEGDAAGEDGVGEDAVRLVAGERDVAVLAVVIPALHAARDRPAAQVVAAMAMRRYAFIGHLSASLVAADTKTRRPPCRGGRGAVAILRQGARFRHGPAPEAGC